LEDLKKPKQYILDKRHALYNTIEASYQKDNIYYVVGSDLFLEQVIMFLLDKGHDYKDIEIDKKANKRDEILKAITL
jgi:hypothetical protein